MGQVGKPQADAVVLLPFLPALTRLEPQGIISLLVLGYLMAKTNPSFLNGVPELCVLQSLGRRAMYGYELAEVIRARTGDVLRFGEGVIYPTLHALQREGYLRSSRREVGGRSRVYYELTVKGRRRLEKTCSEWSRIQEAVRHVLGNAGDARTAI
jgi:PadR family transcriptional regulator PadR